MLGEFKVYTVEGGYQVFWCPSAPLYYTDRIAHDKVYSTKQAAYRRKNQLEKEIAQRRGESKEEAVA